MPRDQAPARLHRILAGARRLRTLAPCALAALLLGCAATGGGGTFSGAGSAPIPIEIVHPNGPGPFPAVVALHSCAGSQRGTQRAWAQRLAGQGYVVALPDSFTPRGFPHGVCGDGLQVTAEARAVDAYAALHLLEQRPDVRPDRIGLIGFSHGGWTVVVAMDGERAPRFMAAAAAQHGFAAAVALYPFCPAPFTVHTYRPTAALLILGGRLDDWTPVAPCEALAARSREAGLPVTIQVYPDAHHAFDAPLPVIFVPEALGGRGATIGGNDAARQDSIARTYAFFGAHLKHAPGAP